MYQDLHFYVDFDWEHYSNQPNNYLQNLHRIVQLAYQHKATVFYSQEKVEEFIEFDSLDENFSQSKANMLQIILENAKAKRNQGNYCFQICFSHQQTSLFHINNITTSIIDDYLNNALISLSNHPSCKLLMVKSDDVFKVVNFELINDEKKLINWIQSKSKRAFNLSNKHGENGKGNWQGESVLLCNKIDAQTLLDSAIPDFSEKENRLFNFDPNHQTFIEFFYEGDNPQKQWHGFHITKNLWKDRVPQSIREYFGKYS